MSPPPLNPLQHALPSLLSLFLAPNIIVCAHTQTTASLGCVCSAASTATPSGPRGQRSWPPPSRRTPPLPTCGEHPPPPPPSTRAVLSQSSSYSLPLSFPLCCPTFSNAHTAASLGCVRFGTLGSLGGNPGISQAILTVIDAALGKKVRPNAPCPHPRRGRSSSTQSPLHVVPPASGALFG